MVGETGCGCKQNILQTRNKCRDAERRERKARNIIEITGW